MSRGRIVFMGTPPFAVASLNALVEAGFDVAAVVTAPDRPAGRGRQLRASAVKERAIALGLPVLQPEKLRDPAFLEALDRTGASLSIVVAFRMLPEVVWSRPELGTVNLHASLLPDLRGAAPINHALINGHTRTGVTTFLIGAAIDTGDILLREVVGIGPDETAGELHDRLMRAGAALLVRTADGLCAGTLRPVPQSSIADGTPLTAAPKLSPATCRIDWRLPVQRVHDLVRGLSPQPGAWTRLIGTAADGAHFKVLRTFRCMDGPKVGGPGSIAAVGDRLFTACGDGTIELLHVQPEGRRPMSAADLLRGARGIEHARFE